MNIIDQFKKKARGRYCRIIFPEGDDERIIKAAWLTSKKKIVKPILVGNKTEIEKKAKKLKINIKNFKIIEPSKSPNLEKYAKLYSKKTGTPEKTAKTIAKQTLFFSALALAAGDADGAIGGCVYTSGEMIAVSKKIIGLKKGISVASSYFIMDIPDFGVYVYADASVNPNPTAEQLADIAVMTGISAKSLLGIKPRIAMLSFSTKGSADHKDVCKVIRATEIAKKKSGFLIDGELQADAALRIDVAKKKIKGVSKVAGKANVLIFPDLDAGNIAYKLTQYFGKANAYGPILQGFAKPVSDLSRGATVEDIIGIIAIIAVLAGGRK